MIKKNDIKINNLKSIIKQIKKTIINTNINLIKNNIKDNKIIVNETEIQNNFCENEILFSEFEIDEKIKITNAEFKNKSFNMYVYKKGDAVSEHIINIKNWESIPTNNILNALDYYSKKNKINKNNIYIIDIGANIGWYTFTLSKFGYNLISFEPSKINYYILSKSFCINKNLNITLINKGLYNEDKKCDLYYFNGNEGNSIINCNNNITLSSNITKVGEIILTKLDNYLPFIKGKNLLLVKIDVEGSEGKVFEGGIKLITQYHIPFIFMEFTPSLLKLQGTDSKQFLQMFINSGYTISPNHFLDKNHYTIDYIIKNTSYQKNLYITHLKVLEN